MNLRRLTMILGAVAVAFVLTASGAGVADEGRLPDMGGAIGWLNSAPLNSKSLRGKVVLVNFWTYSCINSLREMPYIKGWATKYKEAGLVVIGVHTPEFSFETERVNVENAVRDYSVTYPVAIDSNHKVWEAFSNEYWPADYFIDGKGRIRYHHFGEGDYGKSERIIQELLKENGATGVSDSTAPISADGVEAPPSEDVQSPETYVGYGRTERFASLERLAHDLPKTYNPPARPSLNQWGPERHVDRGRRRWSSRESARQGCVPVPQPRPTHGLGSGKGR